MEELIFQRFSGNARVPVRSTNDAAGYDILSGENKVTIAFGCKLINTNIPINIPKGTDGRNNCSSFKSCFKTFK